jgi:hypothetical protein
MTPPTFRPEAELPRLPEWCVPLRRTVLDRLLKAAQAMWLELAISPATAAQKEVLERHVARVWEIIARLEEENRAGMWREWHNWEARRLIEHLLREGKPAVEKRR